MLYAAHIHWRKEKKKLMAIKKCCFFIVQWLTFFSRSIFRCKLCCKRSCWFLHFSLEWTWAWLSNLRAAQKFIASEKSCLHLRSVCLSLSEKEVLKSQMSHSSCQVQVIASIDIWFTSFSNNSPRPNNHVSSIKLYQKRQSNFCFFESERRRKKKKTLLSPLNSRNIKHTAKYSKLKWISKTQFRLWVCALRKPRKIYV